MAGGGPEPELREGLPRFFKGPKTPQLKRSLVNSEVNSLLRAKLKG
jgi:hypothetical protein